MTLEDILIDIHSLEEELLDFERKYGVRSDIFYAAYISGEEPEDENWVLDFGEWASVFRTWLARQATYRDQVQRIQRDKPTLSGLIRVFCMNNALRTIKDYELFIYTLTEQFPVIQCSTLRLIRRGTTLARVEGETVLYKRCMDRHP